MLLKYLSDAKRTSRGTALFRLAALYVGADEKWRDDTLQVDFAKLPHMPRVFLYHCRDDELVPVEHLALYARKLPEATVRKFQNGGHQFKKNLGAIAEDIKKARHQIQAAQSA